MSELLEFSFLLSIFAGWLSSVQSSSWCCTGKLQLPTKRSDERGLRKQRRQFFAQSRQKDFLYLREKRISSCLFFAAESARYFAGLYFRGWPSVTHRCLPPRPLSKSRQMTSIPAAAANRQNTRAHIGTGSSTISAAVTRDIKLYLYLYLSTDLELIGIATNCMFQPR
jgi:hypothetical protein